jgi:arylsulfatase A-like enzyme
MPTFAELAETKTAPDTDGLSLMPTLTGKPEKQKQHEYLYWEHAHTMQAVRYKDLKGLRKKPDGDIEIYNLKHDPQEKVNIAKDFPEIVEMFKDMMINCRTESELYPIFKKKTVK